MIDFQEGDCLTIGDAYRRAKKFEDDRRIHQTTTGLIGKLEEELTEFMTATNSRSSSLSDLASEIVDVFNVGLSVANYKGISLNGLSGKNILQMQRDILSHNLDRKQSAVALGEITSDMVGDLLVIDTVDANTFNDFLLRSVVTATTHGVNLGRAVVAKDARNNDKYPVAILNALTNGGLATRGQLSQLSANWNSSYDHYYLPEEQIKL